MTPAPIDPLYLAQREAKRHKDRACESLRKLRLVSDELISARREIAELRRVHPGESKVG